MIGVFMAPISQHGWKLHMAKKPAPKPAAKAPAKPAPKPAAKGAKKPMKDKC